MFVLFQKTIRAHTLVPRWEEDALHNFCRITDEVQKGNIIWNG